MQANNSVPLILLLGAVLCGAPALAVDPGIALGELVHSSWTTADGLPQNSVTDIVQTQDGYLWISTFGGLARFDGWRFTIFDVASSPGLLSNRITALYEDPDGVLWLGTERGIVCRRRKEGFDCFGDQAGLTQGTVWAMLASPDGLWVASARQLALFKDGRAQIMSFADGLGDAHGALVRDVAGDLWVGQAGGVARWDGRQFEFHGLEGLDLEVPHAAVPNPKGGLWLAAKSGVFHLREGEARQVVAAVDTDFYAQGLLRDRDGNLWFFDRGAGRLRDGDEYDNGERLLDESEIRVFHEDREGNIWIGTGAHGLHRLHEGAFTNHPVGGVNAVIETTADDMVVALSCGGVSRLRGGELSPIADLPQGAQCTNGLLEDRAGRLWIAGNTLAYRDRGGWTTVAILDAEGGPFRALYEDRQGAIWIGRRSGLGRYVNGHLVWFGVDDGHILPDVRFITEDSVGHLWVAGADGLTRFANGEITPAAARVFTREQGLPDNYVRAVQEAADGTYWLGTYGSGLVHLDPEKDRVVTINRSHGLPENVVSSITEDGDHFWLSGNRGITRLRLSEVEAFVLGAVDRIHGVLYDESDGMHASETNGGFQPAVWRARDGRIWYPTIQGLTVLDPERLEPATPPPVMIREVRVNGRPADGVDKIVVPPGERNLEIDYTGIQLGLSDEVRFRYRLAGHDENWIEAHRRRTAYYTQVPPGTYRFEVATAAYNGGRWSREPAFADVVLQPFFYETRSFRFVVGVLALGLIAVGAHLLGLLRRRAELQRYAAELNATVIELEGKNAEMERFVYTISHDLRSPLMTIQGYAGYVLRDLHSGDTKAVEDDVREIAQAGDRMAELLRDLLELSRIGRVVNDPQKVPLNEIVNTARQLVAAQLEQHGVEVDIAAELPTVMGDKVRLIEVFQNLLDNAARFMGDQPEPRVVIGRRHSGGETVIFVEDNGIGIAPAYHQKVFGLFDRLDAQSDGTGIGLAIVRRIVEYHGGRIWVESEGPGRGTTVCMTLPLADGRR